MKKTIFYHLHNPDLFTFFNFANHYRHAKFLILMRNPIKMIESWILADLNNLKFAKNTFDVIELTQSIIKKICNSFLFQNNPVNSLFQENIRGVKLEDIKKIPKITIPKIAKWIGIKESSALYQSEFMNKQYSRPSYSFNNITGFDSRSIEVPKGRFFGKKDIKIIETLLWPLLKTYGYTSKSKKQFLNDLNEIEPLLDNPLEFELNLHNKYFDKDFKIQEMDSYKMLHQCFSETCKILNSKSRYLQIIKPLV